MRYGQRWPHWNRCGYENCSFSFSFYTRFPQLTLFLVSTKVNQDLGFNNSIQGHMLKLSEASLHTEDEENTVCRPGPRDPVDPLHRRVLSSVLLLISSRQSPTLHGLSTLSTATMPSLLSTKARPPSMPLSQYVAGRCLLSGLHGGLRAGAAYAQCPATPLNFPLCS